MAWDLTPRSTSFLKTALTHAHVLVHLAAKFKIVVAPESVTVENVFSESLEGFGPAPASATPPRQPTPPPLDAPDAQPAE